MRRLTLPGARALVSVVLVTVAGSALAQIPRTMSYQGRLLDSGGAPVANGDYDLTFKLYEVPSGPDLPVWSETQSGVTVSAGLFHVLLGSNVTLDPPFDRAYWLGIAIDDGNELTPRIALAASPYSLNARDVAPGAVVKSLNGLKDDVTLAAGSNIAIVPAGQTLTISATGGGLTLPFANTTSSASTLFDVTNSGVGGSGSFRISNAGNTNPALYALSTGLGPALVADGIANVGSSVRSGELHLIRSGVASSMMQAITTAAGGRLQLHDESGNQMLYLAPDNNGSGGFMDLRRDATNSGLLVDGNFSGTGAPRMDVIGPARFAGFDMSVPGDDSVVLPGDAVSALESLDEPGVAYQADGTTLITLDGTTQTLLSRSITVPASGYVIAIGSLVGQAVHTNLVSDAAIFGLGTAAGSFATDRTMALINPSGLATATYYYPVTVQGVFSVSSGSSTFYLLGDEDAGSWRATDLQLTLIYVRTAYGTVASPLAGASSREEVPSAGLGPAEVQAEQAEALSFDRARLERELGEMRARLDELQRRIGARQGEPAELRHGAPGIGR
jgi:hypothetical protein